MRDDIGKLDMPPSAKRYARLTGARGTSPGKFGLYTKMVADLVNGGRTRGFRSKDASASTSGARAAVESMIPGHG